MSRLSIIIPVLGSSARLETTLVSVLENRPPDCEILVVVDEPYDDPYDLSDEVQFLQAPRGAGLVEAINQAVQASEGELVHILSAGFKVADGWTDAARGHFKDPLVASVSPLIVDSLDPHKPLAAGLEYSCRRGRVVRSESFESGEAQSDGDPCAPTEILGPIVQAAFYRRTALELVGGLPRAVGDGLADADLALTFRYAGYRSVLEPRSVVLAAAGDIASPRAGFRQGLAAERLFWRAAPVTGWSQALAAHPTGIFGDLLRALPRPGAFTAVAGRLVGACQMGSHRAHHQWLVDVRRAASALFRPARQGHMRIDGPHEQHRASAAKSARLSAESAA